MGWAIATMAACVMNKELRPYLLPSPRSLTLVKSRLCMHARTLRLSTKIFMANTVLVASVLHFQRSHLTLGGLGVLACLPRAWDHMMPASSWPPITSLNL